MNNDFAGSPSPEDPRAEERACQFGGSLEQLERRIGVPAALDAGAPTECLSCINDFARLRVSTFTPTPSAAAAPTPRRMACCESYQEMGAFMLARKRVWLLPLS